MTPGLSVVVPVYNELENVDPLVTAITEVMEPIGAPYEVVLVDDGSTDGSSQALDRLAAGDAHFVVLHFEKNCGQSLGAKE